MLTWQAIVFSVLAGCAIGCLLAVRKAVERLSEGVFFIRTELTKLNSKLEAVQTINKDEVNRAVEEPDTSLEAIEAAISSFEKLKRIDLTKED